MHGLFVIILSITFLSFSNITALAKQIVYDTQELNLKCFFSKENTRYVIRYKHISNELLVIPDGCELIFRGGHLICPLFFRNTKLSGDVNLKGSTISGRVKNKLFNASWLCAKDGETDDTRSINEMITVCGHVYFPSGKYRLTSAFDPVGRVPKELERSIRAHIGVCKSNVILEGEQGAILASNEELGVICIFSQPNQIENSISNIIIKNIEFKVLNDGLNFHEYLHTIKAIGVNGLVIEGCKFSDFWGDAICLSHYGDSPNTGERTRNTNVKILENLIIGGLHHNNRNGISIISGKNVLIKSNLIKETSRKDMPGGIDIEPNNSAYTVENIQIVDNYLENILGGGGAIGICVFNGGPAHRITIKNNIIRKCTEGIQLYIMTENTTDDIIIKNNLLEDVKKPFSFEGEGKSMNWTIEGNTYEMRGNQKIPGRIFVDKLVVKNNKKKE